MSEQPSVQSQPTPAATATKPRPAATSKEEEPINVTQQLAEAQRAILDYDKESVKTTQEKYQAYLRIINDSQKDPEIKNEAGKTVGDLRDEWEQAVKTRTDGRVALERKIQEIINPALAEQDADRKKRLLAIQEMSEAACLEKNNTLLGKYKKPELERAIDQIGGTATKPFKESSKF